MAIQPETIAGRKEFFRRKREEFAATWTTDSAGNTHIPLGNGHEALISRTKETLATQFLWYLKKHSRSGKLYVEASVVEELQDRYGKTTSLHRVMADAPRGVEVDHRDGNGLNCVDGNLRIATRSQNAANRHYDSKTGYRGVVAKPWNTFIAQITYEGTNRYLGSFANPLDAALAYNAEALRLFGEFAILNRIPEGVCR